MSPHDRETSLAPASPLLGLLGYLFPFRQKYRTLYAFEQQMRTGLVDSLPVTKNRCSEAADSAGIASK